MLIFPLPQEMQETKVDFKLNEDILIPLPGDASDKEIFLTRFLVGELSDRYGLALRIEHKKKLPSNKRIILMGSVDNPLIKTYCSQHHINLIDLCQEGYILEVKDNIVLIAGADDKGVFYGLQSLRQLIEEKDNELLIHGVKVQDRPYKRFRGLRIFLPGKENIPFFKRLVRDFMALYKFNKLFLEVNAGMRLDKHPELNAGWIEFAKNLNYTRQTRVLGSHQEFQDSAHHDTADGGVLEKEEVADLVQYANKHYIDVIPEIPSLTHSYYLLTRHRELAEIQDAEWPDTYCPSNPKSYELLFDVLDEYIEVMRPKMVHIGHDEWRMPTGVCLRCKGKDISKLFIQDVNKIYNHLKEKGIKVAMWGDHLLESVRGKGLRERVSPTGYAYKMPGALSFNQVREQIPKDILILNWTWNEERGTRKGEREENEIQLENWGFKQIYGNLSPLIQNQNYVHRSARPSVIGGASSSWAATNEFNFGKDLLHDFLGCANLFWSKHWPERGELSKIVQDLMPQVRQNLKGRIEPSDEKDPVVPIDIAPYFNVTSKEKILGADLSNLKFGRISIGRKIFKLADPAHYSDKCALAVANKQDTLPHKTGGIKIGEDVSSIIFLHACAKPAVNDKAFRIIYNFPDTADLLGYYEVVYEDNLVNIIPLRYGVNILEWNVINSPKMGKYSYGVNGTAYKYCYEADAVICSKEQENPVIFFAYEWINPRFGKRIKEVHLVSSKGFKNTKGEIIPNNAVILIALSVVKKRTQRLISSLEVS